MNKIKNIVLFIPLVVLVFIYITHAGGVFSAEESSEYLDIISGVGFSAATSSLLMWLVLPLDGAVALLLIFGNKVVNQFPWGIMFIWAGVWPWVPRLLEIYGGLEPEPINAIIASISAALAYWLYKKKDIIFFSQHN